MLNHIDLLGRVATDIDVRYTSNNTPVANFTIAVERDFSGNEKVTDFITIVVWGKSAEFTSRNFHKGSMMAVSGRLQSRKWEDKNGQKRINWEVVADSVYFGGDKKSDTNTTASTTVSAADFEDLSDEDTIPF